MKIFQTLLATVRREIRLVLTIFFLTAIAAVALAYSKDPVYQSAAKMWLNFDARPISASGGEMPPGSPVILAAEVLTTLTEVMKSDGLIERLVDRLGEDRFAKPPSENLALRAVGSAIDLARTGVTNLLSSLSLVEPLSPRQKLVDDIADSLSVFAVRQSQVVELTFDWDNPIIPPLVLQEFVVIFQERVAELNAQAVEETLLTRQAELSAKAIESAQQRLADLRESTGIVNMPEERQNLAAGVQTLERMLASDSETGWIMDAGDGVGADFAALRKLISDFKIERAGLLSAFTPDSPELLSVTARLEAAETELASLRESMNATLAENRKALDLLLSVEQDFYTAQRELDLASESFRTYSLAATDRRVMRLSDEELRLKVIDAPAETAKLTGASRLMTLFAGLIAAAVVAVFYVLLKERLTVPVAKPEQQPNDVFRTRARRFAEAPKLVEEQSLPRFEVRVPGSRS